MSHTLLVWNACPDEITMYLIPKEVSDKYTLYLDQAHNKMINSDDMNEGMRFLNTALASADPEEGFEEYLGVLAPYKCMRMDRPLNHVNIIKVYLSGFVM